jgi:phospholipid/cholesterol/gamma-HCH transport system substrate-binding protein
MEIAVGLFVAGGLAALFMLAMQVSNLSANISGENYTVTAAFQNIGGLKVRSPVTVSGVRVGRVEPAFA